MLQFLTDNSLYIVLIIVLSIWIGIFSYLYSLDKRLKSIEKKLNGDQNEK